MRKISRSSIRRLSLLAAAGLVTSLAGQMVGCSSGSTAPGSAETDNVGTLKTALTLSGGEVLNAVNYTITGPSGIVQSGMANVSNSNIISITVGTVPAGSGYTITLTGTTADGAVTCSGTSAPFSVLARQQTNVTVLMGCGLGAPDAGSISVGGQTYHCGTATGATASPSETTIGNSVSLTASGIGPNPSALTYTWSAPSGVFSNPNAQSTNFTCTTQGAVTVSVTVSDGAVPAGGSCNTALSTSTAVVQCDPGSAPVCSLGPNGAIKHVIYVQFDNTHLTQDEPNVASDLVQMPALLNFIRGNGTMLANDHTVLISHTGGGILSTLTGVYPDRHGQIVSNSYVRTSATGSFSFPSSFQYWSNTVATNVYNLTQPDGTNMQAPWVTFTKAGCSFGAVGIADMELENVTSDITNVFGANSPQAAEAKSNFAKAVADFEGIAVHCALSDPFCATGQSDLLPASQNYNGFKAIFGAQGLDPLLTGSDAGTALTDLLGNPITDSHGNPGFPGFDGMSAAVALSYVASLQEHGVPVTFTYLSDAHDNHGTNGSGQVAAYGPGQQGYEQQLASYNQAFANFFARLAQDGINQSNTLFVFTVDEGDHFVGVAPQPSNCDGTPGSYCNYPDPGDAGTGIGEINVNIDLAMSSQAPAVASNFVMGNHANPGAPFDFTVHGDDAPAFYLSRVVAGDAGQTTGPLPQTDPMTRAFERAAAGLTEFNPYTGNTDNLLYRMADQAGMAAIHMSVAADPSRVPTFTLFADDDYYITDFPSSTCADCAVAKYAWNHGDDQNNIGSTWIGLIGPGIVNQNNGPDNTVWTDHTDVRPTMLSVLGLQDSYVSDGRVITQALQANDYSANLSSNLTTVQQLGDAYKQINSPFDLFGQCILSVSTVALQGDDATYTSLESQITSLTGQRDALARTIKNALNAAEFGSTPIATSDANNWISQANGIVTSCATLQASAQSDAGH